MPSTTKQTSPAGSLAAGAGLKRLAYLLLACAFSAGLFYYLVRTTTWREWLDLYAGLHLGYFAAFLVLYLVSMYLRAARYRLLLGASASGHPPRLWDLITLTFASQLFVDLLPARSGSLAYIVLLNQRLKVDLSACFSSFAFSFIFDLIGMLPLFLAAIVLHQAAVGAGEVVPWILLGILAVISITVLCLLEDIINVVSRALGRLFAGSESWVGRLGNRAAQELARIASDIVNVKKAGVYGRLLAVSLVIRLFKYLGLYFLILGLAGQWGSAVTANLGFSLVLFALIAAEATASLPVSGIAGFGAYEGVMMAVLAGAGLDAKQAALLSFGLHLLTQTIDYSLGGLALIRLSWLKRKNG